MLALNVGNAWAEETHTIGWGSASGTNFTNFTTTSGEVPNVVSFTTAKNNSGSNPAHNSSNNELRLYYNAQGNGGSITLTPADGVTITGFVMTTSTTPSVKYTIDGGTATSVSQSNKVYTVTGISATESLKIQNVNTSNTQLRIKTIQITYTKEVATGPTLSATPNKVDFGTKNIYFDSEKEGDLEIDITGQNLTGNVTATITEDDDNVFSLSSSSFAPNAGEVSEKLTVSYNVSEAKDYTATLTLSSDGVDAIELPITLTTVNKKPTIYTKVTDAAALSAGDKVIFVYESGKAAAGAFSSGYLTSIDIAQAINATADPATVSITDEAVVEYTLGGTTGAWELISASGKLSEASANSSGSVNLAFDKGTKWTISISSGDATIKGTTNTIKYNTSSPRFKTYSSGQTAIQLYAISVPKYAVNFTQPEGGELIVKNGETAITSGNTFAEGIKLTITATPANGYEGGTVVVEDAVGNDVTATVYADGVLTMPAYAVTISATFEKKECTLLATPTVSAETTYNSATLTWDAVDNAAKYSVKVGTAEAVETTETSYELTDLNAATEYTYQVQAIAEAEQDTYCDSEVAEGTFTTATAPTATLTLSDIEGTTTKTGALNGTITLPTEAAECSKTFVGWDSKSDCAVAPEYAPGAEYTFTTLDPTLYAVYADGEGGGTVTITPSAVDNDAENDIHTFTIDAAGYSLTAKKNSGSSAPTINASAKDVRIYAKGTVTLTAPKALNTIVFNISTQGKKRLAPITASVGTIATQASGDATVTWTGDATEVTFTVGDNANYGSEGATKAGQLCFGTIIVTSAPTYSNYSTTCAAAPIATVNPTSVTATAAGVNGTLEVSYENVLTENVSVALYNDDACTEAFTADWLTASLDGDKNITYTVAATTLYTERKAYIQLTAPEENGTTEPAKVVIPVTQAGKDKVFASLAELVAADLTAGDEVTVTLNNDVIKDFYIYSSKRCGVVFDVQKDGKDIKIYFNNQTTIDDWAVGGKLSGTLTNVEWTTYSSAWQLAPANTWAWANLTYTEPKAVSTVVVTGAPTKTTYVDGEAFDPAGLTVTVNYNDATTEVNPTGVTFTVTPATLVKGQTSVSVTATFNSVASAAYEVTGLTVNDIPTKTVAEFIAAGGTRCYLEGIVSNITNTTYGNFDLTDASGTIYVYGCLNAAGESQKFADLGVKNGDKIKVIADEYEFYQNTTPEAKDVQYVSHKSAATIEVADIAMKVGETHTISATVTPEGAPVTYAIKEGSDNYITLNGAEITAIAAGTATIVATIAETADYMGAEKEITVTVTAVDTRKKAVSPSPFTDTSGELNPNDITYTSSKGGGTGGPNIKNYYIQLYQKASGQSYGGFITFNAVKGCKIDQVMIVTGNTTTTHIAYSVDDVMSATTENVQKNAEYITEAGLNAESVNIYCMHTNSDNRLFIASAIVYYTGQPLADPELSWTSNTVALRVGEAFTAPTLDNPYNVTGITYSSDNESLVKVNATTGAVTLVPDATGTAIITATFAGDDTYKAVEASYTITVKPALVYGVWDLVTNHTTLAAGDKVIIVAKDDEFALSINQGNNNRGQAEVTKNNDNTVAFGNDVQVLTLEAGTVDNTFALNTGNGYLYASSTSSNQLKTQKAKDANASWEITITDGTASIVAQGDNTRNVMQYNQLSSLFACYASASQKALCLYMKKNVKVEGETDNTSIPNQSDVTVDDAELTVTTEAEYDNMYIGNNGSVDVEETVTVNNLYIQTTMGTTTSGQLNTASENLIVNGDAFIDITLGDNANPQKWHAFTVPFPVDAMNGIFDLNDNKLTNGVNYAIMQYHGDVRAQGKYGWKKYSGTLVPGTFYLMTVDGARTTYRFKKVKDADLVAANTKSLSAYTGDGKTTDYGWNGVGNPTLMHGKVAYNAQILDPVSYTYVLVPATSSAHFTVGTPFFIQAETDGTMTMVAETSASLAPARRAAATVDKVKVMLGNADYTDYLYVSASEDATNEYEIGKDLAKMTMTNTPIVPQIFAHAYGTYLCMVNVPMTSNEATVALNLYAPAEGEYTLSVEEQADATVYLLYNGNIVWNLSMGEYPIHLTQGNNAGYSLVVRRENAPTDVENIFGADEQTEKFIYNGNLYILHEGKVFDAVGNVLK